MGRAEKFQFLPSSLDCGDGKREREVGGGLWVESLTGWDYHCNSGSHREMRRETSLWRKVMSSPEASWV